MTYCTYFILVGFGRACAPVLIAKPKRALRAPHPSQLRCSPKIKNKLFPGTKCLPSGPNSGRQGHIFFYWAKLHPTELRCNLLSYAAPPELRCTLLIYAAPY